MTSNTEPESGRSRRRHYEGEPKGFFPRLSFHFHRKRRKIAQKFMHRLIQDNIELVPTQAKLRTKGRLLLSYFGKFSNHYSVLPIIGYEEAAQTIATLAEETTYTVVAPQTPDGVGKQTTGRFPAIKARLFDDVDAAPCSAALIVSDRICIPNLYLHHTNAIISDRRYLFWQSEDGLGLVYRTLPERHAGGIMLFGSGANNWYHWLLDVLPSAHFASKLPAEFANLPLVIPDEIARLPTFRDSLELFRDGREVVTLGPKTHRFDQLVEIDGPILEPMNMRTEHWPDVEDYAYHPSALLDYRNAIRNRLGISNVRHDDRVFLARGHGRRAYNQDELLAIAERYGFRAVFPERLSFQQQVEMMTSAALVVGPSGAAFANTLFCEPGTRLLSWLVPQYRGFCSYTNIAQAVGAKLRYLFTTPDRPVNSTFDGFSAAYRIDPAEFEAALRMALDSPDNQAAKD